MDKSDVHKVSNSVSEDMYNYKANISDKPMLLDLDYADIRRIDPSIMLLTLAVAGSANRSIEWGSPHTLNENGGKIREGIVDNHLYLNPIVSDSMVRTVYSTQDIYDSKIMTLSTIPCIPLVTYIPQPFDKEK